jgi:endonuclease/exonuclease/phosphatase family metal-dependent hydrolase
MISGQEPFRQDDPFEPMPASPSVAAAVSPGGAHAASSPAVRLRVLTLNLHKGFSAFNRRFVLHEIRAAVRLVGADIVFLQEVLGASPGAPASAARNDTVTLPQYEFLADSIWPQHAYGHNAVSPAGHHGNALLSKYTILRHRNIDVSTNGRERRGLLHCVIEVPGLAQPLHAVCVHLGLTEGQRQHQIDQLCRLIDADVEAGAPVLVAGDFNDWRLRGHRRLAHGCALVDVHAQSRGSPARTFPARHPVLRLDRIYVRDARRHGPIALPRRPWSHLSDHTPLAAELLL